MSVIALLNLAWQTPVTQYVIQKLQNVLFMLSVWICSVLDSFSTLLYVSKDHRLPNTSHLQKIESSWEKSHDACIYRAYSHGLLFIRNNNQIFQWSKFILRLLVTILISTISFQLLLLIDICKGTLLSFFSLWEENPSGVEDKPHPITFVFLREDYNNELNHIYLSYFMY